MVLGFGVRDWGLVFWDLRVSGSGAFLVLGFRGWGLGFGGFGVKGSGVAGLGFGVRCFVGVVGFVHVFLEDSTTVAIWVRLRILGVRGFRGLGSMAFRANVCRVGISGFGVERLIL